MFRGETRTPDQQKQTVLWGQSQRGAVLKLRDDCPGFENPKKPKAIIYTGHAPAQRFGNEIHSLTVDFVSRRNESRHGRRQSRGVRRPVHRQ